MCDLCLDSKTIAKNSKDEQKLHRFVPRCSSCLVVYYIYNRFKHIYTVTDKHKQIQTHDHESLKAHAFIYICNKQTKHIKQK